ncbi:MAG: hypothetical protein WDM91_22285 [Rhizomicrobium sp.]
MDIIVPAVALLVLVVIVFGGTQLAAKYVIEYRIADDSLQYFLFGLRFWTCPFDDILDIKRVSFFGTFIVIGLNLMSRPFGPYVLLRRRRGCFKLVLLTPPNAESFVKLVRARITTAAK